MNSRLVFLSSVIVVACCGIALSMGARQVSATAPDGSAGPSSVLLSFSPKAAFPEYENLDMGSFRGTGSGGCVGCLGTPGAQGSAWNASGTIAITAYVFNGVCNPGTCVGSPCEVEVISDYALYVSGGCSRYRLTSHSSLTGKTVTVGRGCVEGDGNITEYDTVACGDTKTYTFTIAGMTATTTATCSACAHPQ